MFWPHGIKGQVTPFTELPGGPANLIPPVVTGDVGVCGTLTSTDGFWTGDAPIIFTYQWYRDGVMIPGEITNEYTLPAGSNGSDFYCVVTGINNINSASAESNRVSTNRTFINLINYEFLDGTNYEYIYENETPADFLDGTEFEYLDGERLCFLPM